MLVNIKAFFLYSLVYSQAEEILYAPEEDDAADGCPTVYTEHSEGLCAKEAQAVTIESAFRY